MPIGLSGWLLAASFGAWTPFWVALIPAILVSALERFIKRNRWAWAMDAGAVVTAGFLAKPPLSFSGLVSAATIAVVGGVLFDGLAAWFDQRVPRFGSVLLALGVGAVLILDFPKRVVRHLKDNPERLAGLAVSALPDAERLVLPTGAVAWVDPQPRRVRGGALFLHGYHQQGSNQPAAVAIRRSLSSAGYIVVSADSPGFGESPSPAREAPLTEWDPLASHAAAYEVLKERVGSRPIVIIGHSMGTGDAARLLSTGRSVQAAALLGAGFSLDKPFNGSYWHKRFNRVHNFDPPMPMERFIAIANAFFDKKKAIQAMPADHAPVLYIEFTKENRDLAKTREQLYSMIPGRKSRATCESSHYLDVDRMGEVLIGDARSTSRLAKIFEEKLNPMATGGEK